MFNPILFVKTNRFDSIYFSFRAAFPKAKFSKLKRRRKLVRKKPVTCTPQRNAIAVPTKSRNKKTVERKPDVKRSIFKKNENAHDNDTDESEISGTLDDESDTDIDFKDIIEGNFVAVQVHGKK